MDAIEIDVAASQRLLLEPMQWFHDTCRAYGITYWLDAGSVLGAVRHGGFIPWDDDIDVGMLRSDFGRFMAVANDELPPHLELITKSNQFLAPNAKVALRGTRAVDTYARLHDFPLTEVPLSLDVFVFDRTPASRAGKKLATTAGFVCAARPWAPVMANSPAPLNRAQRLRWRLHAALPAAIANAGQRRLVAMTGDFRGDQLAYGFDSPTSPETTVPVDAVLPTAPIAFAGREFFGPRDPEVYVASMYGPDFMTPPPEARRRSHFTQVWAEPHVVDEYLG